MTFFISFVYASQLKTFLYLSLPFISCPCVYIPFLEKFPSSSIPADYFFPSCRFLGRFPTSSQGTYVRTTYILPSFISLDLAAVIEAENDPRGNQLHSHRMQLWLNEMTFRITAQREYIIPQLQKTDENLMTVAEKQPKGYTQLPLLSRPTI